MLMKKINNRNGLSRMKSFFVEKSIVVRLIIFTCFFSVLGFIITAFNSDSGRGSIFALNSSPILKYIALQPIEVINNYNFVLIYYQFLSPYKCVIVVKFYVINTCSYTR
jgi:hypothetical protein